METLLLVVLIILLCARWFFLHQRFQKLDERIADLTSRLFQLEKAGTAEPVRVAPSARAIAPIEQHAAVEVPLAEPEPVLATSDTPPRVTSPTAAFRRRVHDIFGEQEWEALVGGSLLNKVGALVLVIGIALFLGYSFTYMTPSGRALTALGASLTLLCGGVLLERQRAYRGFARGLIGAGWAAFYVTAYAVYAVPAARLIQSPYVGSILLLIIATGMIGHSLFYRVQAVTSVAYFAAFAALSVTPWSSFALISLVPLSASLLFLAYRFRWTAMAVFGVAATYAACVWHGNMGAPLLATEALLFVYWVLFEAFDLLRIRNNAAGAGVELVFPLNALAFLGLSYQAWSTRDPAHLWVGCAFTAALYLFSAVLRGLLEVRRQLPLNDDLLSRMKAGRYEAAIMLSACLAALAIALRLVGVWMSAGWAIEAEVIYLSGIYLGSKFLRSLASAGFAFSIGRLVTNDIPSDQVFPVGYSRPIHAWSPIALFLAILFYVNRFLRKPNIIYSSLAVALMAAVLSQELPERFVATAWLVFAAVLFEIGIRKLQREFRFQAYALAAGGVIIGVCRHLLTESPHSWIPLTCALGLVYALTLRQQIVRAWNEIEQKYFSLGAGAAITTLAFLLTWRVAPQHYKAAFTCILAMVLFELGARKVPAVLVRFSYLCAAVAVSAVLFEAEPYATKFPPHYVPISYFTAAICLYLLSERAGRTESRVQVVGSSAAILYSLCASWFVIPDAALPAIWSGLAVVLFLSGLHRDRLHERYQSYLLMIAAVLNAWINGFHLPAIFVILACYLAQFLSPAQSEEALSGWLGYVERHRRSFWSLLGTTAMTLLLYQQFPGGLRTTAWGIEGLTLLIAGFPLSERILRLQGLAMLLVCILKLFLYDLRNLETVYRILSFVALGIILLGVSSIYTHFRERVGRYL